MKAFKTGGLIIGDIFGCLAGLVILPFFIIFLLGRGAYRTIRRWRSTSTPPTATPPS